MNTPTDTTKHSFWNAVKKVLFFSTPIICNSLLNILPSLASIWILARLGKDQLAAAAIATPTYYTIITVFLAGFYAVGIKVGHCFGKDKNSNEIGQWVRNAILLALLACMPAIIILLNVDHLLLWFGQQPHLVKIAEPFFFFGAFNIIFMLINSALNQYLSGIGHPKIALILSVITLPLVVALSYLLVLGKIGFPQLGLGGINCASLIVDSIVTVCAIFIIHFAKWSKPYRVFSKPLGLTKEHCVSLVKLGWPISVQVSGELAAMTATAYLLGLFGVSALAAAQITGQYVMVFVMISMGLSSGVAILVSQAHGQKNLLAVKHTADAGMFIIGTIYIIFIVAFFGFPTKLIDLYLNSQHPHHGQLVRYAKDFMMIAALYLLFDGIRNVLTSTLRGLQDPVVPMKIGIAGLWLIGLPCAYLAGFVFHGGPVLLRLGFTVGVIVAAIWIAIRYKRILNNTQLGE